MTAATLCAGFTDTVHDAQSAFRAALEALARPGRMQALGWPIDSLPLGAALSHLLLALTDEDTLVWWQQEDTALADWLRFHTGARATPDPAAAAFAVIVEPATMPALTTFAQGSLASPEFSTTLLVEVDALQGGELLHWHGPGIRERQGVAVAGLPAHFWPQWQANHAAFPQGVDAFFTCGAQAIGLPRTTRVARVEGV